MRLIAPVDLRKAVAGKKILVDTNIIIYLTDSIQPYVSLSRMLFEMIEKDEAQACFSIVTIAEVMQGPLKRGFVESAMKVRDFLLNFPNTFCQEITAIVLEQIGEDNRIKWSKLRIVDSLIIASGLINGVEKIISNDKHFMEAVPESLLLSYDKR